MTSRKDDSLPIGRQRVTLALALPGPSNWHCFVPFGPLEGASILEPPNSSIQQSTTTVFLSVSAAKAALANSNHETQW